MQILPALPSNQYKHFGGSCFTLVLIPVLLCVCMCVCVCVCVSNPMSQLYHVNTHTHSNKVSKFSIMVYTMCSIIRCYSIISLSLLLKI
jgi:hypothetical protein